MSNDELTDAELLILALLGTSLVVTSAGLW